MEKNIDKGFIGFHPMNGGLPDERLKIHDSVFKGSDQETKI